jgi:hypothetical protein
VKRKFILAGKILAPHVGGIGAKFRGD